MNVDGDGQHPGNGAARSADQRWRPRTALWCVCDAETDRPKIFSSRKYFLLRRLNFDSICAISDANARASGEVGKQDLHPRGYVATVTSLKELSGLRRAIGMAGSIGDDHERIRKRA